MDGESPMMPIRIQFFVGGIIFLFSFVFYFVILFLLKTEFFEWAILIISILFAVSFLITKTKFLAGKTISLIAFIMAVLLNAHLIGWIQLW